MNKRINVLTIRVQHYHKYFNRLPGLHLRDYLQGIILRYALVILFM
jgi:hypothetical protein